MPLPNVNDFIGPNVTEQGFKEAQKNFVEYVANEIPTDGLRPLNLKNLGSMGIRFNKAVKSISLRGDHNGKLITVALIAYVNGVFTLVLARPDSLNEQMSSTNSKNVARFTGSISFSGVQTLTLESYSNVSADINGFITIDFNELLQSDSLSNSYIASDRLLDSRAIIDLNGQYNELKDIKTNIVNLDAKANSIKSYVDVSAGVIFTKDDPTVNSTRLRINQAIKNLSLTGDHNGKLITLASISFVAASGTFTIVLARPDSLNESMAAASNTKFVSRFTGIITFAGVQTLTLTPYGNTAAEIAGTITIDFDKLLQTDLLVADYIASDRLFLTREIIDLNGQYTDVKQIKNDVGGLDVQVDDLSLVIGTDVAKNKLLNATIQEIVFFKDLPTGYLNAAALFYGSGGVINLQIYNSADKTSKGTLWAAGTGTIKSNKATIMFDQGYAVVDLNNYVPDNTGAALLADNATYNTRGITRAKIRTGLLNNTVFERYSGQFVDTGTFHLPWDYVNRGFKLYIKGDVADTDYYLPGVLIWTFSNNKYVLTYQIRKMTAVDQIITAGTAVYSGTISFDNLTDIKGIVTIDAKQINNHPLEAKIDFDFNWLEYRTDYNNNITPYFFNNTAFTHATKGFDIKKLRRASKERFSATGGLTKYASLREAVNLGAKDIFAIGGNLFKSIKPTLTNKSEIICVNNPPKLLSRKAKEKAYDFYYKQKRVRLEIIDADDSFFFVNADYILKAPHVMKQTWTEVGSVSAADFVVFDVSANKYYSIPNRSEVFTKEVLAVDSIFQARLTYDDELFIIAVIGGNKSILITENSQTSLRTFNFDGLTGTRYIFGAGVNVVKDWCMSHHKNIMFVSDYDSGVNGVRGTTGGQKCYVSLDNGYTFTKCFDFTGNDWSRVINASNITSFGAAQAHIHAVTYDPKQNVVWIVTGDGAVSSDNSSFFWSHDLGETWTHKRTTLADNGARSQMIMALPFDGCVAFGSDDSSLNGLGVITYDGDEMVHEVVKNYANKNVLLSFARSTWARPTSKVKYMSFGKDAQQTSDPDAKSFVVASSNGYTWETMWEDNNAEIYGNVFCYDDRDGKLYISLDGSLSFKERVLISNADFL
ncbi:hypothetical protein JZM39_04765 [Acinetobacter pittii]|uniref:hypothetical protein n=1 Tax=Acinetobacter pittii TaxID=48296 RepID=UPI001981AC26|nr:hypothetical protein [Acinetobacter pittii]MBN6535086.1 hypothetical protein [Acinetobacter pittii]